MPVLLGFVPPPSAPPPLALPKINYPGVPTTGAPPNVIRPGFVNPPYKPGIILPSPAVVGGGGSLPPVAGAAAAAGGAAPALPALSIPQVALAFVLAIPGVLLFHKPAGSNYYDENPQNPIPLYNLHPPEAPVAIEPPIVPFTGGQGAAVRYRVFVKILYAPGDPGYEDHRQEIIINKDVFGAVRGLRKREAYYAGGNNYYQAIDIHCGGGANEPQGYQPQGVFFEAYTVKNVKDFSIVNVVRLDNQPDTAGDPPFTNTPIYSPPGNSLGPPIAAPPSVAPLPIPSAPPSTAPSPSPPTSPGTAPGVEPPPKKYPGPVPAPIPAPGSTPQPNKNPDPNPAAPEFFPSLDPSPTPGVGVGSPSPAPTPTPTITPTPNKPPTWQPSNIPSPVQLAPTTPAIPHATLTPGEAFTSDPNPAPRNPDFVPAPFQPNPDTGNPEPKAPPLTIPPTTPAPTPTPTDDLGKQIQNWLGPITIALAGVTALVHPDALKNAANAGSCQSFAPGGCNAPIANNAASAAANSANNGTALSAIMAFLQALQAAFMVPIFAGVNLINTKLGPVMSGLNGIGGFLSRTAQAAKLDKILNAMNTVLLLHNAAMLSRNLGSTLGDLTSQALATIGIKDGDSPIDINAELGKQANSFMAGLVGAEVWAGTKTSWNKASSIISSATNLMYTVRSMFDSTREILEWTAENTGKIGNALKRFRIVGENAYKWLPEQVTVQNSFTRKLDRLRAGVDDLDDAASSLSGVLGEVQSIQSEYADLQEQKQKFDANIKDLTPKPRADNKPVTDAVTAAKTASLAPPNIENVFRGEGEQIDA